MHVPSEIKLEIKNQMKPIHWMAEWIDRCTWMNGWMGIVCLPLFYLRALLFLHFVCLFIFVMIIIAFRILHFNRWILYVCVLFLMLSLLLYDVYTTCNHSTGKSMCFSLPYSLLQNGFHLWKFAIFHFHLHICSFCIFICNIFLYILKIYTTHMLQNRLNATVGLLMHIFFVLSFFRLFAIVCVSHLNIMLFVLLNCISFVLYYTYSINLFAFCVIYIHSHSACWPILLANL